MSSGHIRPLSVAGQCGSSLLHADRLGCLSHKLIVRAHGDGAATFPESRRGRGKVSRPEANGLVAQAETGGHDRSTFLLAAVIVALATIAVFAPALLADFTNWDDDVNVTGNPYLVPLRFSGIAQLWTQPYRHMYIPLVYSSYAMDAVLGGGRPWPFHLTNLLCHVGSALLLLSILLKLSRLTPGRHGPGADLSPAPNRDRQPPALHPVALVAGALVFAIHPLQVEAVAWITGRKDVLSGFLALLAWRTYLEVRQSGTAHTAASPPTWSLDRRSLALYVAGFAALLLSLLAKPATVTTPLAILAADYFLLRRSLKRSLGLLAPWFALCLVWVVLTSRTQDVQPELVSAIAPWKRVFVAGYALVFYAWKIVFPLNLAPVYGIVPWEMFARPVYYIALPVSLVAVVLLMCRRTMWAGATAIFIAFVLPVLGLMPFRFQIYSTVADRYVYLSMTGLSVAVAFGLHRLIASRASATMAVASVVGVLAVVLGFLTVQQSRVWKNSESLWLCSISVAPDVAEVHNNLGVVYGESGRESLAYEAFRKALEFKPDYADANNNLGLILADRGRVTEAIACFQRAVRRKPGFALAHSNLGAAYAQLNRREEAIAAYRKALSLRPTLLDARANLALVHLKRRSPGEARKELAIAMKINPRSYTVNLFMGMTEELSGRPAEAASCYRKALEIRPGDADATKRLRALRGE